MAWEPRDVEEALRSHRVDIVESVLCERRDGEHLFVNCGGVQEMQAFVRGVSGP